MIIFRFSQRLAIVASALLTTACAWMDAPPRNDLERMLLAGGEVKKTEAKLGRYVGSRYSDRPALKRKLIATGFVHQGTHDGWEIYRYDEKTVQFKPVITAIVSFRKNDWRATAGLTFL